MCVEVTLGVSEEHKKKLKSAHKLKQVVLVSIDIALAELVHLSAFQPFTQTLPSPPSL